jgi:fumarate hydratase class II
VSELALGGSAVGTGINVDKGFAKRCIQIINKETGHNFKEAKNHFEAQGARDSLVELSGVLKTIAVGLIKIANDIRWLGSGPRCGLGELILPDTQPGSSIMPGKVNPVIAESLIQACAQIIGNDATITYSGQGGNFELNAMMPVMAYNLLQSIEILSNSIINFRKRLVEGLKAHKVNCTNSLEKSLAMVTSLAPEVGYEKAALLAKKAHKEEKTIREVLLEEKVLPEKKLSKLLDPEKMV